ncbi:uncharacterized protein [Linepithema humile]|uniref:uncharacterized protein n=1 Tax=Linepithema humile TaxID=83485 RepID=UPI00351DF382
MVSEQEKDSALKVLGMDPKDSKFKQVKYHPELKNTWLKWKNEGLPEKNKKEILESYNRKGDLYMEAPQLNLEIIPLLTEVAKKRDQHFTDTQNCVGTAIAALGAAVSMLLDPPEEGLDEDIFTDYISHAGQILTDVFHQQSIARKSFITPQLNKSIKPVVDTMFSDDWLYGDNLKEKTHIQVSRTGKLEIPTCGIPAGGYFESTTKASTNEIQDKTIQNLSGFVQNNSSTKPIIDEEIIPRQEPSIRVPPFINGRQVIRSAFLRKGLTEDAIDVMIDSITKTTLRQYECSLKRWWEFAHLEKIDLFNAKTTEIIKFLNNLFKKGASYSTLNTTRSTVSLISIYDINKDGLISRFLKGVFKQRPSIPKYATTWDITPVLNYIEKLHPLKELNLREAGEKVVTLLALTTAQRLQTLSLIDIDNIVKSDTGLNIKITERIKTSRPGAFQPELILPFFKEEPGLCVASAILDYIDYTKKLRNKNNKRLFIATVKPFGAISSQTIGHWIKRLLGKAGVDTNQFTAYSTRHAAVSAAYKQGVDITAIRRSAG